MIFHIVETGDEAEIVNGFAAVEITRAYEGPISFEIWETRPHVLKISEGKLDANIKSWKVAPPDTLKVSIGPGLLRR